MAMRLHSLSLQREFSIRCHFIEFDVERQKRGDVAKGRPKSIPAQNTLQAAAADMGIDAKDVHEGRMLREAKKAKPGFP